jgi:alanine racemase
VSGLTAIPAEEAGSILTVDLGALVSNWRMLAAKVAPAECAAVVKANGYGLGIEEVGAALAKAGCRSFFVAQISEGRRLRAVLPDAVIYILNGIAPSAVAAFREAELSAVVGAPEELDILRQTATGGTPLPYALHIDTGMNRLGLAIETALEMIGSGALASHAPRLVMSHFVSSEDPLHDLNRQQIDQFDQLRQICLASSPEASGPALGAANAIAFSLSNSSGIFLKDRPFYDLVRPGFALYGGNPTPGLPNPMSPVVTLESRILQIRPLGPGQSVGYNAQWSTTHPSVIATISLGYADGIFRSLSTVGGRSGGGTAVVNAVPCPFAGRVSMDLITLDVTNAGRVSVGDRAILLGDGISVDDMAEQAGTNGYNILTSLGTRFHRRFVGG